MPFQMNLWQVDGNHLLEVSHVGLADENRLENWIAHDVSILGLDIMIIGRQVSTSFGGRIDLLGIDQQGDIIIVELKRDKTPRDVIGQILDYASWVQKLSYQEISAIAQKYLDRSLADAFRIHFEIPLPENINTNHSMVIVAPQLDVSSERIVQYLADVHEININVIFFSFFKIDNREVLGRVWLMDPEQVHERSESRRKAPWTGYWFVNVGEGVHRNWDDNRQYNFIGAGQGPKYSGPLKRLSKGDKIFAYMKGLGYVGYGEVTQEAQMIKDFIVESVGKPLINMALEAPQFRDHDDDPALSEWVVGVKWVKTFPRTEARWEKGLFANQNIVCKLFQDATLEYLCKEFQIDRVKND